MAESIVEPAGIDETSNATRARLALSDDERRELRRTIGHLEATFPNVFLAAAADNLVITIYGSDTDARKAVEIAEEALKAGPAHIERRALVTCTQSQTPRMMRGLNEPAGEQPKIIGDDDRGVFLRCLPSEPHNHDWGRVYDPLNPRVYS